jgi:hypothetical protein
MGIAGPPGDRPAGPGHGTAAARATSARAGFTACRRAPGSGQLDHLAHVQRGPVGEAVDLLQDRDRRPCRLRDRPEAVALLDRVAVTGKRRGCGAGCSMRGRAWRCLGRRPGRRRPRTGGGGSGRARALRLAGARRRRRAARASRDQRGVWNRVPCARRREPDEAARKHERRGEARDDDGSDERPLRDAPAAQGRHPDTGQGRQPSFDQDRRCPDERASAIDRQLGVHGAAPEGLGQAELRLVVCIDPLGLAEKSATVVGRGSADAPRAFA